MNDFLLFAALFACAILTLDNWLGSYTGKLAKWAWRKIFNKKD